MKNSIEEEYIKILQDLVEHQYSDGPEENEVPPEAWVPSESIIAKRAKRITPNYYGSIDVTNFKKDKIKDAIYQCMNIKVGEFLIKITSYNDLYIDKEKTMNIAIWEKRYRTPSGNPCNMEFKANLLKDTRFTSRPWLNLFTNGGSAIRVPMDTLIDIIRWLQAIKRMTVFL